MPSVRFAPTGVGSLPFTDFPAAAAHVGLRYADRPFLPEPALATDAAGFVARCWPVASRAEIVRGEVALHGDPGDVAELLSAADLERLPCCVGLAERIRAVPGATLDAHVVGPVTLLRASRCLGAPGTLWDHPRLRERAAAYVGAIAARTAREIVAAGKRAVIVLDEPLYAAPAVDVDNPANLLLLSTVVAAVDAAGGRTGLHSCGEPPLDLLLHLDLAVAHFDARRYRDALVKRRRTLERFLRRGGELGLGVFDAREPDDDLDDASRLLAALPVGDGTGILISAACGTGAVAPERELRLARNLAALRARLLGASS